MTTTALNPHPSDADKPLQVRRIRLSDHATSTAPEKPHDDLSSATSIELAAVPDEPPRFERLESSEELLVFEQPTTASPETRDRIDAWFLKPAQGTDQPPITMKNRWGTIRWRPGRAVIECAADRFEILLLALTDFALLESELRRLDAELRDVEGQAGADVTLSCRVQWQHRSQWDRLVQITEQLLHLRLAFTRLESQMSIRPPLSDLAARNTTSSLLRKTQMPARMEAYGNRLEACEDLYNGALDRIAEFRGYQMGEWLEIIIIVLLALEVVVNAWHVYGSRP